ncbi:MAG: hypothetical protein HRU23_01145 [Gammaproteobacteria bacterium]|nr:hypothetical protein [Gammaproteobacteria bacterium]
MSRLSLVVSLLLGALLMSGSAFSAQSVTALYRVAKVQHVLKLIDDKCVEEEKKVCPKSQHWRVYYRALSLNVSPQKHQELLDENPPQIGAVIQLTITIS